MGVADDLAGDLHGGLGGDALEGRLDPVTLAAPGMGDLDEAGVVADQHELHAPLEAEGVDPAVDGDRPVEVAGKFCDEGTRHDGNSLIAGALVAPLGRAVDGRPGTGATITGGVARVPPD